MKTAITVPVRIRRIRESLAFGIKRLPCCRTSQVSCVAESDGIHNDTIGRSYDTLEKLTWLVEGAQDVAEHERTSTARYSGDVNGPKCALSISAPTFAQAWRKEKTSCIAMNDAHRVRRSN